MPAPKGHPNWCPKGCGGVEKEWTPEKIEIEADELVKWINSGEGFYYKEFSFKRGYHSSLLWKFCEWNEKFRKTFKMVQDWQEFSIAHKALKNEYNASFSKFFMANVSGWSEKNETTHKGDPENPLSIITKEATQRNLLNQEIDDEEDSEE